MPDQSGIGVIHAPGRAAFTAHGPDWTAQYQEVAGRTAQDYRKRIDLLDDEHTSNPSPQAQTDTPDLVYQRRTRFVQELETRLQCLKVERATYYALCQAHRINDELLRNLVSELDLSEVSLHKRLAVARRAAARASGNGTQT